MAEMKHSTMVLAGIEKKCQEHTLDLNSQPIDIPELLSSHLATLEYAFESTTYTVDSSLLFDQGDTSENLMLMCKADALYIYRNDMTSPGHDHAKLQVCRLTVMGDKIVAVQVDVPKATFVDHLETLGEGSSLIDNLKKLEFPEDFPDTALDLSVFAASAEVLAEEAKKLLTGQH